MNRPVPRSGVVVLDVLWGGFQMKLSLISK